MTSLAVLGSGVALAGAPHSNPWLLVHMASFVLWSSAVTIHVLAYAWRRPRVLPGAPGGAARAVAAGGAARWLLMTGALAGGLLLALLTVHLAAPWHAGLTGP
jgi:hypothetical protein